MEQDRPAPAKRRLSSILAADVAGYSRLMHNDEEATHAKLTGLLTDAVVPAISLLRVLTVLIGVADGGLRLRLRT